MSYMKARFEKDDIEYVFDLNRISRICLQKCSETHKKISIYYSNRDDVDFFELENEEADNFYQAIFEALSGDYHGNHSRD